LFCFEFVWSGPEILVSASLRLYFFFYLTLSWAFLI